MKLSPTKFPNTFWVMKKRRDLVTLSSAPGTKVYDEDLIKAGKKEYRVWNPTKSKLAAAILKGMDNIPINADSNILYLGASTGTTVSHLADMLDRGVIYSVEFAPRVLRELVFVAKDRKNVMPILASAAFPGRYAFIGEVDFVYQDIAQKDQARIFIKNCDFFLKKGGHGFLCVKARSIDVSRKPSAVFNEVEQELRKHFRVIGQRRLEPYEKDHMVFLIRK